jgi:hypothetical protein
MSGRWVVLGGSNDGPRVRCDRAEHGNVDAPWEMARALRNLYCPDWGTDLETNAFDDERED